MRGCSLLLFRSRWIPKKPIDHLKKCLEASTANREPSGIEKITDLLGDAYLCSGKYETAVDYYEKSLEVA